MRHTITVIAALLAPLSTFQAEVSPSPVANPERLPAYSLDRVPLYAHIQKDTAFTADEIKQLSTFSLITFEKSTGNKNSGSTEAETLKAARAVKAINPGTRILYYRNVIVHYGGYAANASLKDIPGAFLIRRDGNDKHMRGRVETYDLTSMALRDWWLAAGREVCADPAIGGIFLDGMVKVLEPGYLRREIGETKNAAELVGYVRMMKDTRKMLGPQKLMVANVLRPRFPDSGLNDMEALDGSYIEAFEGAVTWMTHPADFDRPLGAPRGPALRKACTYTREFAHASVRLDIEKETGDIVWKDVKTK